jgi:plasmid stabilization system protein ParE
MFKKVYSTKADIDLNDIHNYIAADNPTRAKTFIDEIETVINNLALFPNMGRQIDDSPKNKRFIHGNYKIIYESNDERKEIYIKHIKHCARDEKNYIK